LGFEPNYCLKQIRPKFRRKDTNIFKNPNIFTKKTFFQKT